MKSVAWQSGTWNHEFKTFPLREGFTVSMEAILSLIHVWIRLEGLISCRMLSGCSLQVYASSFTASNPSATHFCHENTLTVTLQYIPLNSRPEERKALPELSESSRFFSVQLMAPNARHLTHNPPSTHIFLLETSGT